jgi:hypothetical protein
VRPHGSVDLLAAGLGRWSAPGGGDARWRLESGILEVVPGTGNVVTRDAFGDHQLHVEFWLPPMPGARGQDRSNGGVYVLGRYELQLLDSHGDAPAANGCGAIYGVAPPFLDASRPAGEWQSLDVAVRGAGEGHLLTVVWNGVFVHHAVPLSRPTKGALDVAGERGPLMLQDHGAAIRFRNLWTLPLERAA